MVQFNKSLVLACLVVTSAIALGTTPIAFASSPTEDISSRTTISTEQIADSSGFNTANTSQQNVTNTSQPPIPVSFSGPSTFDTGEVEAGNNSQLPPPVYKQRVISNETYNQSNSSSGQAIGYNGTDKWIIPPDDPKYSAIQGTTSTQNTGSLFQPSAAPTDSSLNPTINNGIIGPDDRILVADKYNTTEYPWSSIVRLNVAFPDGTRGLCSGAVIAGSDGNPSAHVLTAAHCVYSSDKGGWIDITGESQSYVSPGADGSREPFGRVGIQNIRSYNRWTESENPAYDIALITLDERIGDQTGSLGYVGIDGSTNSIYTHTPTRVTGYPGDKERGTMWTSTGSGEGTYNFASAGSAPENVVHRYTIDTSGGMSGGPAWVEDHPGYDGRPIASVHAYAVDTDRDGETDVTQGTRITRDRFNDIQSWIAEDSVETPTNDRFEPNDDFDSATPITVNNTVTDLQIVSGEFDVFAVNLSSGDRITAESVFNHSQGDLNMVLYTPTQEPVSESTSDTDGEQIKHEVSKNGTYYVAVYGVGDATAPYSLSLNITNNTGLDTTVTATRTIDSPTVSPGGSAKVIVNTTATGTDFQLQENFTPPFANVAVTNLNKLTEVEATNSSVAASWSSATNMTLVYEVAIPETATPKTTYSISGTVDNSNMSPVTIVGDETIEVGTICRYPAYSRDDCTIGARGLVDAAADFRAGTTGSDALFEIAAAFRSGTPLRQT